MRRRKVIPVVGEELLEVEIEDKTVPLYAWMAERLASVLEVLSSELPSPVSLNDVACRYLARNDSNRNSIYTRLSIIVDEANAYLRAPMALRQLAEITDFNLFLTTSFDSLMESVLNEIRRNRKKCRWPGLCVTRPRSSRQPMETGEFYEEATNGRSASHHLQVKAAFSILYHVLSSPNPFAECRPPSSRLRKRSCVTIPLRNFGQLLHELFRKFTAT
jgi:hypothetical protein